MPKDMNGYNFAFDDQINKYDFQKYYYTVVFIPHELAEKLDMERHVRLRVEVMIDGFETKGTLMPDRIGSGQTQHLQQAGYMEGQHVWYFLIPRRVLKTIGKTYGDSVHVELRVGDQNEVEMHPAQEDFLQERPDLKEIWETLTPGKRRSLSYPILKAKTDRTIQNKLNDLENQLLSLS